MLGYIISSDGIWANPDKTKAIMSMVEPSTKKEVQRLTGRIAALDMFISKCAERSLPSLLQGTQGRRQYAMGPEQSEAFQKLKNYLVEELLVIALEPEAPLLLYVAAFDHAVSSALIQEKQIGLEVVQRPVY
jgi:hypothetical protein